MTQKELTKLSTKDLIDLKYFVEYLIEKRFSQEQKTAIVFSSQKSQVKVPV
jgi:hypothetical protein